MSVELVRRIKAELEAKGQRWETNEDAAQITFRVAWALRREGAMLIVKRPAQNGAVYRGFKYSHDAIAFPSGWIDCLVSAGPPDNRNEPAWGATGMDMSAVLVDPFDLDAGSVEPPRPLEPPPVPPDTDHDPLAAVAAALRDVATQVNQLRTDLRKLTHVGTMDFTMIAGALAHIEETQARGVSNSWLALKPPPQPKVS